MSKYSTSLILGEIPLIFTPVAIVSKKCHTIIWILTKILQGGRVNDHDHIVHNLCLQIESGRVGVRTNLANEHKYPVFSEGTPNSVIFLSYRKVLLLKSLKILLSVPFLKTNRTIFGNHNCYFQQLTVVPTLLSSSIS